MYKFTFDAIGYTFNRVNRKRARNAFNKGITIAFCPSNLRPGYPWHPEAIIVKNEEWEDFETFENHFSALNCNAETGKRVNYFEIGRMR